MEGLGREMDNRVDACPRRKSRLPDTSRQVWVCPKWTNPRARESGFSGLSEFCYALPVYFRLSAGVSQF